MSQKSGKAFDWSLFRRLFARSKPYRTGYYITVVLVVVLAAMSPLRPEIMRHMLDVEVPNANYTGIRNMALWFFALLVVEAIIQYYQAYLANKIAQSITLDLRSELYRHVMKFRLNVFDKTPVGQFVTRHISDIDGIAEVFSVGLLDIIRDILKLIVIIGFMFYVDWKMTLIVLLPIPVLLYATRLFQVAVKKSFNDVRNEVSRINVFIQEHVNGMAIIQLFHREKREAEKFDAINKEHRNAHIRGIWAYSVFFPVVELLSAASVSLMLWWGLRVTGLEFSSPGLLLEFSTFIAMMYRPIRQMADNFNVLQMGIVNAERVFKVIDTDDQQMDEGTEVMTHVKGDISIQHVRFAYVEGVDVLKDISVEIKSGEMVAFVGATGAGKSSIANLLNRFYDYDSGSITIDGKDIRSYSLSSLRSNVGVVLQDVFLFSDTIYNNLTLHEESIKEDDVVRAAKLVGAHDFISRLPGAYQFEVRERGGMLSVGQRQLLSFVRAYLSDPKILVLDEATSSVDTESEILIQRATEVLTKGRTSIVIAHRLSTIQKADKIIVMDHGHIVEVGNHQSLLSKNGHYRRLYELQFEKNSVTE